LVETVQRVERALCRVHLIPVRSTVALLIPPILLGERATRPVFNAAYFLTSHGTVDLAMISECLSVWPNTLCDRWLASEVH
jgi:hypothetical protein